MKIETNLIPVISTAHITERVAQSIAEDGDGNEWGVPAAAYQHGFFLLSVADVEGYPPCLEGVAHWAAGQGFSMVRFDCDAPIVDGLVVYNW